MLKRYVHGIGSDDPLVSFDGSATTSLTYLLADERGSSIAETNAAGSVVQKHQYGPYGEPINASTSRFRYTGQILLPGTELYHYKARVYHPKLGRFLQTDPLGYKDGINWYAYVGNDPMNKVDPDGKSLKLLKAAFNVVKRMLKGDSGKDALKGEITDIAENVQTLTDGKLGIDDAIAVVDLATGFGKEAGNLVDAAQGASKAKTIADGVIHVTKDGVALPPGQKYKIPDNYVQNPHKRNGSYGVIDNGKFRERLRIDPPTPQGRKGPNYSHYHLNGKGTHYSPQAGDQDPGFGQ